MRQLAKSIPNPEKKVTPWWNSTCSKAVQTHKKALYKFRKLNTIDNFINLKKARAAARRTILDSKRNSWSEYVSTITSSTPPQKVWTKIRNIKGIRQTQQSSILMTNGQIISSPQDMSETLANTFEFSSSNNNYDEKFNSYRIIQEREEMKIEENDLDINKPFTIVEIKQAIKDMKDHKSAGPDNIPAELIKHLPEDTIAYILHIYNYIWYTHKYPTEWCKVITVPVLKPHKDKSQPNSYRPISMSNCLSKILQKMVNKRLMWYLESEKLLSPIQSGFRNGRSTLDHIMTIDTEVHKAFKNKQNVIGVSFDLEKAYDMAWRTHILKSMKDLGLDGNIMWYAKNFLSNRKFRVKHNGYTSEEKTQQNGVPQGEILSVTLFLIAINKIVNDIPTPVKACLFADDLFIYCKGKDINTIKRHLQNKIDDLDKWCKGTGFQFSSSKTKAIHFSRKHYNYNPLLKVNNIPIKYVDDIKFLGITFDKKLTWKTHIMQLKKECIQRMNILKTLGHQNWGAQKEIIINVYQALIQSKLDYGCTVYGNAKKSHLNTLDPIQNMAMRIATGAFRTSPTKSILCESGQIPLKYRRSQLLMSYTTSLASNKDIPTYNHIFHVTNNKTTIQKYAPIHEKITEILSSLNNTIQYTDIMQKTYNRNPPWIIHQPNINTSLSNYPKSVTHPETYKKTFRRIITTYQNHVQIYTDGSVKENKTGSAIVIGEETHKYNLPPAVSVFTAELFSILQASKLIVDRTDINTFVIITDSLSAINTIRQLYTTNSMVQGIQDNIHEAIETGKKVCILWIPSHVGIIGNDKADTAAREAALMPLTKISLPNYDIKNILKIKIYEKWQNVWISQNNHLRFIKKSTKKWPTTTNRREQIILTRLRIGHTRLTHSYILKKEEPTRCEECNEIMSVKHFMLTCTKYDNERANNNIPLTLIEALSNDQEKIMNVLNYLKETELIKHI